MIYTVKCVNCKLTDLCVSQTNYSIGMLLGNMVCPKCGSEYEIIKVHNGGQHDD